MKYNTNLRVAVLGGAFDPPTFGHLKIAEYVMQRMGFDEVWMMPAHKHTFDKSMSEFHHRYNMCFLINDDERISVSNFQYINDSDSSTLNLYKQLKKKYKETDFYMIIGSDNANVIDKWINYKELIKKVPFIVFERTGQELKPEIVWCLKYPHIYVKEFKYAEISSTQIRDAVKNGMPVKGMTHRNVIDYINKKNLYKK